MCAVYFHGGIPLQKSPRSRETQQTSQAHGTQLRRQLCAAALKRQFDESPKGRRGKIASVLCQLPSLERFSFLKERLLGEPAGHVGGRNVFSS